MRHTGKRTAIGMGVVAICVIVVAGYLLRDDIRWWWRMRGIVQVRVNDPRVNFVFQEPNDIQEALLAVREFEKSLPPPTPYHINVITNALVAVSSFVMFLDSNDPEAGKSPNTRTYSLEWIDLEKADGDGILLCTNGVYGCSVKVWFKLLRDILKPANAKLITAMNDPDGSKYDAALALAIVKPETDGVIEILHRSLNDKGPGYHLVLALGAMGKYAKPEVPSLIAALNRPQDGSIRTHIIYALGMIGPTAKEAIPSLEAQESCKDVNEETRYAASAALLQIRGSQ